MTKTTTSSPPPAPPGQLRYVGPPGQTSPLFGALVRDQQYSADADFAAYLAATHPDYWQRVDAAADRKE